MIEQMNAESGIIPFIARFELSVRRLTMWVYAPNGERIPYLKRTDLIQDTHDPFCLEFTAYFNADGFATMNEPTITPIDGYAIKMPGGEQFFVNSVSFYQVQNPAKAYQVFQTLPQIQPGMP